MVYWTAALPRVMPETLIVRRTRLERASESSASLAAARHSYPLTYRLERGNLYVSRSVCVEGEVFTISNISINNVYWNVELYSSGLIFDETEQIIPGERVALPAVHRWYADARLLYRRVP